MPFKNLKRLRRHKRERGGEGEGWGTETKDFKLTSGGWDLGFGCKMDQEKEFRSHLKAMQVYRSKSII